MIFAKKPKHQAKTIEILDQDENIIKIVLLPDLKVELVFTETQQQILDYFKKYEKNQSYPINWTTLSHQLLFTYKYTKKSRDKVKNWYMEEIFSKQLKKFNETNFDLQKDVPLQSFDL